MNETSVTVETGLSDTGRRTRIVVSSVLLFIGVFGNVGVLVSLLKTWKTASRIYFFILCLCIADMFGVGILLGVDIGWFTTITWNAGDVACKICMFFSFFGTILAHYILASFNVDNVITVCTFKNCQILRRLLVIVSALATVGVCAPMAVSYSVHVHPLDSKFTQCVQFGSFKDQRSKTIFIISCQMAIFWFPLSIIVVTGIPALITWYGKKGTLEYEEANRRNGDGSDLKTFGMDLAMVTTYNIVFVICWTPVSVFVLLQVTSNIYSVMGDGLETFRLIAHYVSITNSCLNPIVYGIFACLRTKDASSTGL